MGSALLFCLKESGRQRPYSENMSNSVGWSQIQPTTTRVQGLAEGKTQNWKDKTTPRAKKWHHFINLSEVSMGKNLYDFLHAKKKTCSNKKK